MSILRYTASLDNTITNAFEENLTTRGTGSNMGTSDVLETFSIYGQASSTSSELSRILIKFPTAQMIADRASGILPASGSVTWKLKLYNAPHYNSAPRSYTLQVSAVNGSWQEGTGLDMESYSDLTNDGTGSNWINANNNFVSASATLTALSKTAGQANTRVLTVADSDGNSVNFQIDNSTSTSTATKIAFSNANSNANQFATNIAAAVNAANTAETLNVVAEADSATVTLTQTAEGLAGNSAFDLDGTAVGDSVVTVVSQFGDGDGKWATAGGDYYTDVSSSFTQTFDAGLENLDIDVTTLLEQWINSTGNQAVLGSKDNHGFGIKLSDANEAEAKSYYTKKFFGRGTEFFFKRPVLEAQFEDAKRDDRDNFTIKSSLLTTADNLNTLFFYNRHRGRLVDIAGDADKRPFIRFYHSSGSVPEGAAKGFLDITGSVITSLTASRESTGIYKTQVMVTSSIISDTYPYLMDVWSYEAEEVLTGSVIIPKTFKPETYEESSNFVLSMTNLKTEYGPQDHPKLRLYAREKNWSPNIYTTAKSKPENKLITSGSYKVIRVVDNLTVVDYGTGSVKYTELSYDQNGNYFEFNMDMLEPGFQYGFKFSIYDDYTKSYLEQPYLFKFRIS
jgi:hypothetical protein